MEAPTFGGTQLWECPALQAYSALGCRGPTWGGPKQGEEQLQCQGHGEGQGRGRGQQLGHGNAGRAEPAPLKALQVGCGCWDCASARGQVCYTHGDTVGPASPALPLCLLASCPCVPKALS